jgi:hypothetical protein
MTVLANGRCVPANVIVFSYFERLSENFVLFRDALRLWYYVADQRQVTRLRRGWPRH